jgi:hypothetical protein
MHARSLIYAILIRSCGGLLLLAGLLFTIDWAANTTVTCYRSGEPEDACTIVRGDLLEATTTVLPLRRIRHAAVDYMPENSYTLQFMLSDGQAVDLFTIRSGATQASNASDLNIFLASSEETSAQVGHDNTRQAVIVGIGWTLFSLLFILIPVRYFIPTERGGAAIWQ